MQEDSGMMMSITQIHEKARREQPVLECPAAPPRYSGFEQPHAEGLTRTKGILIQGSSDLGWSFRFAVQKLNCYHHLVLSMCVVAHRFQGMMT